MNILKLVKNTSLTIKQVCCLIKLISEGNTIPFIARYCTDKTGDIDEEKLRLFEREYINEIELDELINKSPSEYISIIIKCKTVKEAERLINNHKLNKINKAINNGAVDIVNKLENNTISLNKLTKNNIEDVKVIIEKNIIEDDTTYSNLTKVISDELRLDRLPSYKILSMRRNKEIPKCNLSIKSNMSSDYEVLKESIINERMIPSIQNNIWLETIELAEDKSIEVFKKNLKQLLLQPYLPNKSILAIDPGYTHGNKYALIDRKGSLVTYGIIKNFEFIKELSIDVIVIGNGTGGMDMFNLIKVHYPKIPTMFVNEAGASIYSVSDRASKEYPEIPVIMRSAISLAKRVADPLAELVKIEPSALGIGQYQKSISKEKLSKALEVVIVDCVNKIGVDVNTAPDYLLKYVSGLNIDVAKDICSQRPFKNRNDLMTVPSITEHVFKQCAGFLRIYGSKEPLDSTCVHPDDYDLAKDIMSSNIEVNDIKTKAIYNEIYNSDRETLSLSNSRLMFDNIVEISNVVTGIVVNIVDFGIFVDVGHHTTGLVHNTKIMNKENIILGMVVSVRIEQLEPKVSLSMIL